MPLPTPRRAHYGLASAAFDESRKRKPDYPPPYLRWAEVLLMTGNKEGALAHLELGLRQAPKAADLLAQYKRLGGNPEAFIRTLPPCLRHLLARRPVQQATP